MSDNLSPSYREAIAARLSYPERQDRVLSLGFHSEGDCTERQGSFSEGDGAAGFGTIKSTAKAPERANEPIAKVRDPERQEPMPHAEVHSERIR